MERAIPWGLVVLVLTMACFWKPRPTRIFMGFFFALMGLGVHGGFIATKPEGYLDFARQALIPAYARLAEAVVVGLTPVGFGFGMLLFEVVLAGLILSRGRSVRLGLWLGVVFLAGITPLGVEVLPNAILALGLWRLSREDYPMSAGTELRRWWSASETLDNLAGAARIGGVLLTPFLRGHRARWGATDVEVHRPLPGDELVPRPRWSSTRAISIAAAPEVVWPWIAQIGQGRGGLYSYEILENLAGCQIRNADAILPEIQGVKPGDEIRLHPKAPPIPVHELVVGERLLLHGPASRPGQDPAVSWLFQIEAVDSGTRLLVRYRIDYPPGLGMHLGFGPWLVGAIHYAMERRMLLGVRERAEPRAERELP